MQMNPLGMSARMMARNECSNGGAFGWLEGLKGYRRPWRYANRGKAKRAKRCTLRTHRTGR